MKTTSESTNAFSIHISALLGFLFPSPRVLIPLIIRKAQKEESDFRNTNGKEAVNFNITFGFYKVFIVISLVISFFTFAINHNPFRIFVLIGIYLVFELMSVCLIILAATKAQKGKIYHYPMTRKFLQ
jgi:uncharacterized Tic20 family protein